MQILRTVNNYVLVRPLKEKPLMAGIEIPDSVDEERVTRGVVALAFGMRGQISCEYEVGEILLFDSLRPKEVEHNGETHFLIHADDIIAVIK